MTVLSKEVFFVGAFDSKDFISEATSAAGNQVQIEIMEEVQKEAERRNLPGVKGVSLHPLPSWPKGPFLFKGKHEDRIFFPAYVNIFGLKRLIFCLKLFLLLVKSRPFMLFKYNVTFSEVVALLSYRYLYRGAVLVGVIQDVHCSKRADFSIGNAIQLLGMTLLRRFDFFVPISKKIVDDFKFLPSNSKVFPGGLTRQGRDLMGVSRGELESIAVFAGALTKYNGIDRLVESWSRENIQFDLHIYGKGELEEHVRIAASQSSRIHFHGFAPESVVSEIQKRALVNFCLRYSEGIDAGYFFPSKLLNISCAPGVVFVNKFEGFPDQISEGCVILRDDLKGLKEELDEALLHKLSKPYREIRLRWIDDNASWSKPVKVVFDRFCLKGL